MFVLEFHIVKWLRMSKKPNTYTFCFEHINGAFIIFASHIVIKYYISPKDKIQKLDGVSNSAEMPNIL